MANKESLLNNLVKAGIEEADHILVTLNGRPIKATFKRVELTEEGEAVCVYEGDVPKRAPRTPKANTTSKKK